MAMAPPFTFVRSRMPVCSPSTSFAHASTIGANTLIVCSTAISLRLVRADAPRPLTC